MKTITALPAALSIYTEVDAVNDAGVITGGWIGPDFVWHGFVATP